MNEQAFSVIEKWTKIRHPGIVAIHEAFTTRAFGDNCESLFRNKFTMRQLKNYEQTH